jgi:hypothetical protein
MPLLVPALWVLLAAGSAVVLARAIPRGKTSRTIVLDKNLPDPLAEQVIQAILYVPNPVTLDGMAQQLESGGYPCAGYELRRRAWELGGSRGPSPTRPKSCAGAASPAGPAAAAVAPPEGMTQSQAAAACQSIDPTLDAVTCTAVLNALTTSQSSSDLTAFADSIRAAHPRAAALLITKAQAIAAGQPDPFASPAEGAPAPASPPVPLGNPCGGLDGNLTPEQCAQIQAALSAPDASMAQVLVGQFPGSTYPLANGTLATKVVLAQMGAGASVPAPPPSAAQAGAAGPPMIVDSAPPNAVPFTQGEVNQPTIDAAISQAADLSPPVGEVSSSPAAYVPIRPRGYWHVAIRATDKVWPASLAKMGSSAQSGALAQLTQMNPHLSAGSPPVLESFHAGDEVNVPGAWTDNLIKRGFKVRKD